MTEAEKKMTTEEWKTVVRPRSWGALIVGQVFERYQKDVDFVKKGIDKGRFEDAIKDLDELLANIVSLGFL